MYGNSFKSRLISFLIRFIFPTAMTMVLFITSFFSIILPAIEKNSLDRKREMIKELTSSAWTILATYNEEEKKGNLSLGEAQRRAISQIKNMHYGKEMKDYFWINDMTPRMVVHPYREDLNGKDLSNYTDPEGKKVFIEMVNIVRESGDGYVEYMWQWKDDEGTILPKISYIKEFKPWGWIIGTGVYVDDVRREIEELTGNLIKVSAFILIIIAMLMGFIAFQSYEAMKQQQEAEDALRESEEKYRTLVESAGEGMFMLLDGRFMYVNRPFEELSEFTAQELKLYDFADVFFTTEGKAGYEYLDLLKNGENVPERFESVIKTKSGLFKDVVVSITAISLAGRQGFMGVVTDITNRKKEIDELVESEEKFRTIFHGINVGCARFFIGKNPIIAEANPSFGLLFGYTLDDIFLKPPSDFFAREEDYKRFIKKLSNGDLRFEIAQLKRRDGSIFKAGIWGMLRDSKNGTPVFDAIVEDMTYFIERLENSEKMLSQMQSLLLFFNKPISSIQLQPLVACQEDSILRDAFDLMCEKNAELILVRDFAGNPVGVITEHDFKKINISDISQLTVREIMSQPVISVADNDYIYDGLICMLHNKISHVFVRNAGGIIEGSLSIRDFLAIQNYSPVAFINNIQNVPTPDVLIEASKIQPLILKTLIEGGAKPEHVTHLTTQFSDTIVRKFIDFAIEELGTPPVRFSFLVFGSEGREEQTLKTDQDNAIVFEDPDEGIRDKVFDYFLALGTKVCTWLDRAGYTFCEGNNMAMNPEYCQPLSVWKTYFTQWIYNSTPEDLLRTKIFFDFRNAYGEEFLAFELRKHLDMVVDRNPRFFQMLARNIIVMSPPINLFGGIVVETSGVHKGELDIKSSIIPIVDFARIYALKEKIHVTNTLERLEQLKNKNILTPVNHQEMVQAYSYLMQIRLRVQAEKISVNDSKPGNYVNPKKLSYIEQKLLKEIFSQTKNFQARLSYDFTGQLGGV